MYEFIIVPRTAWKWKNLAPKGTSLSKWHYLKQFAQAGKLYVHVLVFCLLNYQLILKVTLIHDQTTALKYSMKPGSYDEKVKTQLGFPFLKWTRICQISLKKIITSATLNYFLASQIFFHTWLIWQIWLKLQNIKKFYRFIFPVRLSNSSLNAIILCETLKSSYNSDISIFVKRIFCWIIF